MLTKGADKLYKVNEVNIVGVYGRCLGLPQGSQFVLQSLKNQTLLGYLCGQNYLAVMEPWVGHRAAGSCRLRLV